MAAARSDVATVILRFRDLVTQKDETIKSHAQVCQTIGRVWWGWWSKAREKVPLEVFGGLAARARTDGLNVFLFDSGGGSAYRAKCTDIVFDPAGSRKLSPAPSETPDYYNKQECLAWFCFSKIDVAAVSFDELKAFSYIDVPEFFQSGENHFVQFDSKMVCSARELRSQDRSVWFVRLMRPSDASHELHLLNTTAAQPEHFPQTFTVSPRRDLLWLSDLHFGHHAFPLERTVTKIPMWMALENACTGLRLNVGGVLISGDLTWKAQKAEFDQAHEFLTRLASVLRLQNYDFLIGPGNHDFAFETPANNEEPAIATATATEAYSDFYRKLFYRGPNEFFCAGRRLLLGGAYPVEIIALNSVRLQQTAEAFQGFGLVGQAQLDFVAKQYGWTEASERRPLRIVMLHHHLVPVTQIEEPGFNRRYSLTLDAEAVMRWAARYRVDLVLHGHMHQPSCIRITRPVDFIRSGKPLADWPSLMVCGLGSSGVKEDHLGELKQNTFGVLSFQGHELKVSMFEIHPSNPTTLEHLVSQVLIPLQ